MRDDTEMSHSSHYPKYDQYNGYRQRALTMSPDRGSYRRELEDPKFGYRYADRQISNKYDSLPRRYQTGLQQPPKRNGLVYNARKMHRYDYSSPYKPIKPEYLTLPSNYGQSKYATLPKSWSVTSSNSYKTHFASNDYHRRTTRLSVPRLDNNKHVEGSYKESKIDTMVPWYMEIDNKRARRTRIEQKAQRGDAYHEEKASRQYRSANGETKKNVTFSEVSGCQENTLVGRPVQVRELEVSFSQVVDKYNLVKEYRQRQERTKPTANGHCSGVEVQSNLNPQGKLPPKPGQSRGFIWGLVKRKYLSQVLAALAVSLAPFAAGLGKGYSSPAIESLQQLTLRRPFNTSSPYDISEQQASWVASLSLLGALFGGVMGGIAMRHGRRKVLLVMSLPFSLSWVLTVFATSVEMMFFTSFMGGFCCSIVSMVSQVYVSEISLPDIRGCLNAVLKIVSHLGVLMSFTVGAYLDWQQLAMFISVAPIMLFCTMIYIPETPSYLVLCGKEEEAYKSLTWLRSPGSDILQELATIRAHVLATKSFKNKNIQVAGINNFNALLTARLAGPVLITCGLMFFQRFSGAHSFNFYAVSIFRKTFGGMNPHGGAIAVSFVQLLASCLSGLLIDTVGRLPLLIVSSVFMSMALAGFGSYTYYDEIHRNQRLHNMMLNHNLNSAGQNDWIPLLCALVFTIAFSLGMSPISWLLIGELFPLEFRGTGSALATAFSYLCAFVGVKTFVDFQQMFGLHGAFWLYAVISVGGLCFVVCCVPETKGRDLDEMDPNSVQNIGLQR